MQRTAPRRVSPQRVAIATSILIATAWLSGCQTPPKSAPPAIQKHPGGAKAGANSAQMNRPFVRRPNVWYPPLEPLPPRPIVVQPPPVRKPAPAPAPSEPAGGTFITAAAIRPPGGIGRDRWDAIVVHHAAAREATPQSMDNYHREHNNWRNGLGYHFVIGNGVKYPDGKIFVGSRWKQQMEGAHCRTREPGRFFGKWRPKNFFNTNGIGICLIGNLQKDPPTPKQMAALEQLIVLLCKETGVPVQSVFGHGEITNKTACPGSRMNLASLRNRVAAAYRRSAVPYASSAAAWPMGALGDGEFASEPDSDLFVDGAALCNFTPAIEFAEDSPEVAEGDAWLAVCALDADACDEWHDTPFETVIYASSSGKPAKPTDVCSLKPGGK